MKEKIVIHLNQLFCRHVYKEIKTEFLEHETRIASAGGMVEVDHYGRFAHHRECIKCGKIQIKVRDKLIHKINVNEQIKQWKEEE